MLLLLDLSASVFLVTYSSVTLAYMNDSARAIALPGVHRTFASTIGVAAASAPFLALLSYYAHSRAPFFVTLHRFMPIVLTVGMAMVAGMHLIAWYDACSGTIVLNAGETETCTRAEVTQFVAIGCVAARSLYYIMSHW